MKITYLISAFFFTTVLFSCTDNALSSIEASDEIELSLPDVPYDYASAALPDNFKRGRPGGTPPSPQGQIENGNAAVDNDNTPDDNPITNEGATLGRVLFYDKNLSLNGTVSCASCHIQEKGFSDSKRLSDGLFGSKTRRHSMPLGNARFYSNGRFFWDERAASLEEQVLMPIQDEVEMGLTLDMLQERVESAGFYQGLFLDAFGDDNVSTDRISKALAQFVRSLVTFESRYDVGSAMVNNLNARFPNFTAAENRGKRLFFGGRGRGLGCDGCHGTEAFIANGPTNIGLDETSTDDQGVFETTGNQRDIGLFKVPSLRNIAVTSPYMHDGRFDTLEEVIEHYNSGVQAHRNLDRRLENQNGEPRRLNLSETDKSDLAAFLGTLTDTNFLTDEKFSDPFLP